MKSKIRIGERIIKYRRERGLTQGECGELCYPDIFLLTDISNLIGISIDELLGKVNSDLN